MENRTCLVFSDLIETQVKCDKLYEIKRDEAIEYEWKNQGSKLVRQEKLSTN